MSKSALDFPLENARQIAAKYLADLQPHCSRIEIAGSIRRGKALINDLEIVAIPLFDPAPLDLFGAPAGKSTSRVDDAMHSLAVSWGAVFLKNGPKYKKLQMAEGICLDLFLVTPPAHWGVIYTLRTGSWRFSNQLVTPRRSHTKENRPGLLPSWAQVEDGQVMHRESKQIYPMPDEGDFLEFCGLDRNYPMENRE